MSVLVRLTSTRIGVLVIQNGPDGVNNVDLEITRSVENNGVVHIVAMDLKFIKEGRDFLIAAHDTDGGVDAVVLVELFEYWPNNPRGWKPYFEGQVNFLRYIKSETELVVAIQQAGIQQKVLNQQETDVDLETGYSENGKVLPPQTTQTVPFHSKPLLKEYKAGPSDSSEFQQLGWMSLTLPAVVLPNVEQFGFIAVGKVDTSKEALAELDQTFTYPYGLEGTIEDDIVDDPLGGAGTEENYVNFLSIQANKDLRAEDHVAREAGTTDINLKWKLKHKVGASNTGGDIDLENPSVAGVLGNVEIWAWIEHRDADDNIKFLEKVGEWNMDGYGGNLREGEFETIEVSRLGIPCAKGDKFYAYYTVRVWGDYENPTLPDGSGTVVHDYWVEADAPNTYTQIKTLTVFEETDVKGVLLYEAIERCIQYYSNEPISFYSQLLGRTDRGYEADGLASMILVTNGHWLRGRDDGNFFGNGQKKLFDNLKSLVSFVNSVFCIGFGIETVKEGGLLPGVDNDTGLVPGTKVFRLELRSHFYRKDQITIDLGEVDDPKEVELEDRYYGQVEYGYIGKLDIGQLNSIDEVNTLRRGKLPLTNCKGTLKIATKYRTSGFQIEYQRRLTNKTTDSNLDDEVFMVVVIRDGLGYRTKKAEGYTVINGVSNWEDGYNYDIRPSTIRNRWAKVLASSLVRCIRPKVVTFNYGEGNYKASFQVEGELATITEDSDLDLTTIEPDHDNVGYVIDATKLTREQIRLVTENPYGAYNFQDRKGNNYEGFLDFEGIIHSQDEKKGSLKLIKVYRP